MAAREIRLDRGKLAKAKRTPQGFVRVDGRLTRIGVLEYMRADGTIQRELRPPEEVFAAKSLESLEGVPVTDLHPSCMVDASNAQQLSRGHVRAPKRDGNFVAAEVTVQVAELINKIDAGDRSEISCGYTCEFDPTPGVWQGQRYDGVQRNIEYNHVAIGPSNWGRAGSEVALRLDAADSGAPVLVARFDADENAQDNSVDNPTQDRNDSDRRDTRSMSLKINGVEIKLDAAEAKLVQDELNARAARADAAEQKAKKLETEAGAAAVEAAALKTRADAAEARVAKVERTELEAQVKPVLGAEFMCDGKSDLELKSAVVAKMLPGMRLDGKDAAFVQGAYAAALVQSDKAAADLAAAARESREGSRQDSNMSDPDKARAEMIERNRLAASAK